MEFSKVIFLFFGLIALSKSKPTQDDVQIEVRELLNQYRATDATNGAVNCSCIEATNCTRILKLLTKAKELSRIHPERKEAINYIRNQTCDKENQGVRCCPWEPKFFGDKVCTFILILPLEMTLEFQLGINTRFLYNFEK